MTKTQENQEKPGDPDKTYDIEDFRPAREATEAKTLEKPSADDPKSPEPGPSEQEVGEGGDTEGVEDESAPTPTPVGVPDKKVRNFPETRRKRVP